MKKYFISVFFCFLAITLFSQVRGVVKEQNGSVLIGANVVWIGTLDGCKRLFCIGKKTEYEYDSGVFCRF